jgi:hypothetical protein
MIERIYSLRQYKGSFFFGYPEYSPSSSLLQVLVQGTGALHLFIFF